MAKRGHSLGHEINYAYINIPVIIRDYYKSADDNDDVHSLIEDALDLRHDFIEVSDNIENVKQMIEDCLSADIPFIASIDYTDDYAETVFFGINAGCESTSKSFNSLEESNYKGSIYKEFFNGKLTQKEAENKILQFEDTGFPDFYFDPQVVNKAMDKINAQYKMLGNNAKALIEARSIT